MFCLHMLPLFCDEWIYTAIKILLFSSSLVMTVPNTKDILWFQASVFLLENILALSQPFKGELSG